MLFLCCLRIANVQCKCTHVRRTCVTTQWVVGENRIAWFFIFSFCQAPWAMGKCCFCVVCALPMYITSAHTYVGLVSRPSGWSEKNRVARIFFLLPSSLVNRAFLFLCCLHIANVQYKYTHVPRTCVTTQWVVGEIRVARIFFPFAKLLGQRGIVVFVLFAHCQCTIQVKYTHVPRICVTTQWVVGEIRVARIFIFSFCQAPWSIGQCCFCDVCALPMYNTSVHTYVGLVSRPSGWSEKSASRGFFFLFAKLPGRLGNVVFVLFAHCQCTMQVHTRT